ncbi:MAG: HEAT repeat domain-containing protein [Planctomycetes bacterium]|nr:HEAT repeat domain-containing protein [Planctomycetota bacterium]
MTAASLPLERLAPLAALAGLGGGRFRAGVPAALVEAFQCRAAAFAHADPDRPEGWLLLAAARGGKLSSPGRGSSPLADLVVAGGEPLLVRGKAATKKVLRDCRRLAGYEPAMIHGWPLGAADGPPAGAILVFDPPAGIPVAALGDAASALVGSILADHLAVERAVEETGRARVLLGQAVLLVGNHPTIAGIRARPESLVDPPLPLLVLGEKGTGKRHLARFLHGSTSLAAREFVEVGAARLHEDALAALLFEGGKGTEPLLGREGFVYVPELFEIPLSLQQKLARALGKEGRVAAFLYLATARDVGTEIQAGRASPELVQLFMERHVELPALQQRPDDLPLLAEHFLREASGALGRDVKGFTHRAIEALRGPAWRGNLLELREVVSLAVSFAAAERIDAPDLAGLLPEEKAAPDAPGTAAPASEEALLKLLASSRRRDWTHGIAQLEKNFTPAAIPILMERLSAPEPVVRMEAIRVLARHAGPEFRTRLLKHLPQEDNRDVLCVALSELAAAGATEARRTILVYLRDESPDVRTTAARALASLGGNEAVAALRSLVSDPHPKVKSQTLASLVRLKQRGFLEELAAMVADERDDHRAAAAAALGEVEGSARTLVHVLTSDPSIDVRVAAATALGQGGGSESVPALVRALEDPLLRFYALGALGRIASKEAVGPLLSLLSRETNSLLRRLAIQALAAAGDSKVVDQILPHLQEPTLAPAVVDALCRLGGEAAEQTLVELVDPCHPLCLEAVKGLGKIGTERSVESLVGLLGTVPDFLARFVARALARIGKPAVEPLVDALADEGKRYWAIVALGEIGDPRAVLPLMEHYDYSVEVAAAIEKIGPESGEPLLSLLPDRQAEIRDFFVRFGDITIPAVMSVLDRPECGPFAEEVLVRFAGASAQPLVSHAAQAKDETVLARILRILGRIGVREGFPLLLKHLASGSRVLRSAVVEGLSATLNPLLVDALLEQLDGDDPAIAIRALGSLSRAPSEPVVEKALAALRHPAPAVRTAALLCAASAEGEAPRRAISAALADRDPLVAGTAARLAVVAGMVSVAGLAARLRAPGASPKEQARSARNLARIPGEEAVRALVAALGEPLADEAREAAVAGLLSRDTRSLPSLWPLVETADAARGELGRRILAGLSFSPLGLPALLREHAVGSSLRRGWIEYHLRAHKSRAAAALAAELPSARRDDDRYTILYLLQALSEES